VRDVALALALGFGGVAGDLLLHPLNVETLSTYIYQFATRGNFEEGARAALLIVAAGIVPVIRMARYSDLAPDAEGSAGVK
jgi:ABC-type Fe3+ transport system permease subunit